MLTIKQVLNEQQCLVEDRNLSWGARLSAYADLFITESFFVGIELIEDTELPKHYMAIDHHNEKSNRPASLLQVLKLLNLEATPYQRLVAANDSGYIPAMKALGASNEEIINIRAADRKAQGITTEDEKMAEKAIRENLLRVGDLILVNALSPHFSPIADRLYPFSKLLISHQNQFVYYGTGTDTLAYEYRKLIKEHRAFHGGGLNGFFGIDAHAFNKEEAEMLKAEIINHVI